MCQRMSMGDLLRWLFSPKLYLVTFPYELKLFLFFLFPPDFAYKSGVAGEVFVGNEKKTNRVCNFWKSSTVLTIKAMQVTVRAIAEFGGYYEKGNLQSNKKIISRPANSRGAESCSLWNLVTKCSRYD